MTYSSSRGPGSSLPTTLILLPGERMTVGLRRESRRRGGNEFLPSYHLLQQHSEDLIRTHVLGFGLEIEQTAVAECWQGHVGDVIEADAYPAVEQRVDP